MEDKIILILIFLFSISLASTIGLSIEYEVEKSDDNKDNLIISAIVSGVFFICGVVYYFINKKIDENIYKFISVCLLVMGIAASILTYYGITDSSDTLLIIASVFWGVFVLFIAILLSMFNWEELKQQKSIYIFYIIVFTLSLCAVVSSLSMWLSTEKINDNKKDDSFISLMITSGLFGVFILFGILYGINKGIKSTTKYFKNAQYKTGDSYNAFKFLKLNKEDSLLNLLISTLILTFITTLPLAITDSQNETINQKNYIKYASPVGLGTLFIFIIYFSTLSPYAKHLDEGSSFGEIKKYKLPDIVL